MEKENIITTKPVKTEPRFVSASKTIDVKTPEPKPSPKTDSKAELTVKAISARIDEYKAGKGSKNDCLNDIDALIKAVL